VISRLFSVDFSREGGSKIVESATERSGLRANTEFHVKRAVRESSLQQTHDPICSSNLTREAVMSTNGALNIVLVHGGFVDGSGWEAVYKILKRDGHHVSVVQNPTSSLADDVAVTKLALASPNGGALLVG